MWHWCLNLYPWAPLSVTALQQHLWSWKDHGGASQTSEMWSSQPCEQWHVASEGSQPCSSYIFIHFNACFKVVWAHMWRKCVKQFPYIGLHWSELSFRCLPQMCYPCPLQMLQSSWNKWDWWFGWGGRRTKQIQRNRRRRTKSFQLKTKLLGDFNIPFRWILGLKNTWRLEKVTLRRLRTTENYE